MSTNNRGQALLNLYRDKGWRLRALNICYIRDSNPDTFQPVKPIPDRWNDTRVVFKNTGEILIDNQATCEPGRFYTVNPMVPEGAFRIAADTLHEDAWALGLHKGFPALVQVAELAGYRDGNENFTSEASEAVTIDRWRGVNQHGCGGRDGLESTIGRHSAGCLVGRYWSSHMTFYNLMRDSGVRLFDTAIIKSTTLQPYL